MKNLGLLVATHNAVDHLSWRSRERTVASKGETNKVWVFSLGCLSGPALLSGAEEAAEEASPAALWLYHLSQ